ncbi:hypothetical protein HG536_0G04260 [Torulaspora globosa]|uniref:Protein DSE2 n=1 Tax=Torulaspora globosa TaxID=48254 RepID=A0A7G3ZM28_9SACH|nr:uncharacterized protein HG536_0G04260 [Torulaspora globosa]QLL34564.1 hypothetical protein HG536_0G04260 [Torulaspora globosa]
MKFQLKSILSSVAFLLAAVKADEVKLFTSDGVVYSYAVVTSTIAPPSVRVETHYYTTFRVRETTLADSEVQTTTEKIISASETTSPVESPYSSTTPTFSSPSSSQTEESRSISTLMPSSVVSLTTNTGFTSSSSSSTSFSQSSSSAISIVSTSSQSASPTVSSVDGSSTTRTTVTGTDGKCTVYYDDAEYYSTVYLTEPNQSVDAATTITSTRLVYETLTLN